ncbi:MAG: phenylalanine--tRNA ligase subunit beta, partial [Chloroflexi bacterium]|nr:phenylalanine--tRNA ligase subunit beta [Chloroflexota bacterium]
VEQEERVRDILVGCGLTEMISYSLTNLESVAKLTPGGTPPNPEAYIRLANPLSREHEYLRQTLMNTTLEAVARNLRLVERVAVFEVARVYLPREGQTLPEEPRRVSIALSGPREPLTWLQRAEDPLDFYDLKGIVETLCERMDVSGIAFVPIEHPTFHPGRVAALKIGEEEIGVLGEVHPMVRTAFDLPDQPVCLAELDLERLLKASL